MHGINANKDINVINLNKNDMKLKEDLVNRLRTEYRKYHNTSVDFVETATNKIIEELQQRKTLPLDVVVESFFCEAKYDEGGEGCKVECEACKNL